MDSFAMRRDEMGWVFKAQGVVGFEDADWWWAMVG